MGIVSTRVGSSRHICMANRNSQLFPMFCRTLTSPDGSKSTLPHPQFCSRNLPDSTQPPSANKDTNINVDININTNTNPCYR